MITSTTEAAVADVSDADFSIFNPVISVTSPNGDENYRTGSSQTITWTDNTVENVKIELFKDGVFNSTIIASTPSDALAGGGCGRPRSAHPCHRLSEGAG